MDLPKRIHRPKFTDQDVRAKVISLRDAIVANLDFIEECIVEDLAKLKKYKELHGDLRYRMETREGSEVTYGAPTQVIIEPLASQYRATINSLLQSVNLIQDKLAGSEDVEGSSSVPTDQEGSKRISLRQSFKAEALKERAPIQPDELEDQSQAENPTKLVETEEKPSTKPISPATPRKQASEPESIPQKPRPWRETTPKAVKASPAPQPNSPVESVPEQDVKAIDAESQARPSKLDPQQVGLSPALRARMSMTGHGLAGIREKYKNK